MLCANLPASGLQYIQKDTICPSATVCPPPSACHLQHHLQQHLQHLTCSPQCAQNSPLGGMRCGLPASCKICLFVAAFSPRRPPLLLTARELGDLALFGLGANRVRALPLLAGVSILAFVRRVTGQGLVDVSRG